MYGNPMIPMPCPPGPAPYGYPMPDQCCYMRYLLTRLRGQAVDILVVGRQEPYRNLTIQMVENGVVYTLDSDGQQVCVIPICQINTIFIPRQTADRLITYPEHPNTQ